VRKCRCPLRVEFTADTRNLATLLADARLPAEWPTESLRAAGELTWPADSQGDLTARASAGRFGPETGANEGNQPDDCRCHPADGQIELANVQRYGARALSPAVPRQRARRFAGPRI
jgi:hypothetical protein